MRSKLKNLIILDVKNFPAEGVYVTIENIKSLIKNNEFVISDINKKRYKKNFLQDYKVLNKTIKEIILEYDYSDIKNVLVLEANSIYNINELEFIINKTYDKNTLYTFSLKKDKYKEIYDIFNKSFEAILFNSKFDKLNKIKNNINNNLLNSDFCNKEISILIPCYNEEKVIKRCIESCLNQNFKKDYEIIIVDDGSTDKSLSIVESFKSNKIYIYKKVHEGITNTLNFGLKYCKGKYILRMDCDDSMYDYRLTYQYDYMENHPLVDVLCSNAYIIDDFYNKREEIGIYKENIQVEDLFIKDINCFICHPATCIRREVFQTDLYDNKYNGVEDYEFWCRLIKKGYNLTSDKIIVLDYTKKQKTQEKKKLVNSVKNKLYYDYIGYKDKKIAIYYLATGIYTNDFPRFLQSVKYFFPGTYKKIILLADKLSEYDKYYDELNNIEIEYHFINDYLWPTVTLFKMYYIELYKVPCDYVFYFNANSEIIDHNDYSWFDPNKLNLTYHKDWFFNKCNPAVFVEPYMDNPNSTSYIGTLDYTYVQAAFFGGCAEEVYKMCKAVNEMLKIDMINYIITRYYDETYLNKYNYLCSQLVDDNPINISNILISQIWYNLDYLTDIVDNKPIEKTQFVILHENIYNLKNENKKEKFGDNYIKHHNLYPLYNFDNIYEYKTKYPDYSYTRYNYENNPLIILFVNEMKDYIPGVIKKLIETNKNYKFILFLNSSFDSTEYFKIKGLKIIFFNQSDIINKLNEIKYAYLIDDYINDFKLNILYNCDTYSNQINAENNTYSHIFIMCDNNLKDYNKANKLLNKILSDNTNFENDLVAPNIYELNIKNFNTNFFVKKYNYFRYIYKYKRHLVIDGSYGWMLISHNALNFLNNTKDFIKNTCWVYGISSLLYNHKYKIKNYTE